MRRRNLQGRAVRPILASVAEWVFFGEDDCPRKATRLSVPIRPEGRTRCPHSDERANWCVLGNADGAVFGETSCHTEVAQHMGGSLANPWSFRAEDRGICALQFRLEECVETLPEQAREPAHATFFLPQQRPVMAC